MNREEVLKRMDMFLHKQCSLERTRFAYGAEEVWDAVYETYKAYKSMVRCEDCKHLEVYEHPDGRRKEKKVIIYGCGLADGYVPCCHADGFCSEGERK